MISTVLVIAELFCLEGNFKQQYTGDDACSADSDLWEICQHIR